MSVKWGDVHNGANCEVVCMRVLVSHNSFSYLVPCRGPHIVKDVFFQTMYIKRNNFCVNVAVGISSNWEKARGEAQ